MWHMLLVIVFAEDFIQTENWNNFDINFTLPSENEDLLVVLDKSSGSETLFLLAGFRDYPSISESWEVNALYDDFYGYANYLDVLYLRIPYSIANLLKNTLKIGVYKQKSGTVGYSVSLSTIGANDCHRKCLNDGVCVNGLCKCFGFNYIAYDCDLFVDALIVNKEISVLLGSYRWEFFRIAVFDSKKELKVLITNKQSSSRAYQLSSNIASNLPSMITNDDDYYLKSNDQTLRNSLKNTQKTYYLLGFFCVSDSSCGFSVKVYEPNQAEINYFWIIIASVISLVTFCICTPFILVIIKRIRRHRAAKIADSQVSQRKQEFNKKYPEIHYKPSTEPESCTICLEDLKAGVLVRTLNCTHTFHSSCILEWYLSKSTCPLCKRDLLNDVDLTVQNLN